MQSVKELFNQYFEVFDANNQDLVDESFRIRYQVYCIENVFEDASAFTDEKETDKYDARSVHSLIHHKSSQLTAATVRLVLADPANPASAFPIEEFCKSSVDFSKLPLANVPREQIAEVSRFAVSKNFKKRLDEQGTIAGVSPDVNSYPDPKTDIENSGRISRMFPHISIGLFQGIVRMSADHNVKYWYAVMEPSLLRLLSRFGICFNPIGPVVNYHGMRQPCFANADEVLAGIYHQRQDIWELITDDGHSWPPPERANIKHIA